MFRRCHVQKVCLTGLQIWAVAVPMGQMAPQASLMGVQPPLAPMLGPSTHPPAVAKPGDTLLHNMTQLLITR